MSWWVWAVIAGAVILLVLAHKKKAASSSGTSKPSWLQDVGFKVPTGGFKG